MEARENFWKEKEELKSYLSHINWDWWFLRGQLILIMVFLIAAVCYALWLS